MCAQITREQLDLDDMIPYPPVIMMELAIKQLPPVPVSIEVDVLGITETGGKFILKPKSRQSNLKLNIIFKMTLCITF